MKRTSAPLLLLVLCLGLAGPAAVEAQGRQFRAIKSINTPHNLQRLLPPGAVVSQSIEPVPREAVQTRMQELLDKWNSPDMADTLAEVFYDRTRLLDAVDTQVPRDARLRLQSVQGSQTLQQYTLPAAEGRPAREVSIVSATVRTQLEYSTASGLVRLPGTNEFLLEVVRTVD